MVRIVAYDAHLDIRWLVIARMQFGESWTFIQ